MFLVIGGFILLALFAAAAVGGVLIFKHTVNVLRLKGKLLEIKARHEIENASHELRITEHKHGQHVLQLTTGTQAVVSEEGKAQAPPEQAEKVKDKDVEVVSHPYSKDEWVEGQKLRKAATDAKFS
jgi:hypothetical protein